MFSYFKKYFYLTSQLSLEPENIVSMVKRRQLNLSKNQSCTKGLPKAT